MRTAVKHVCWLWLAVEPSQWTHGCCQLCFGKSSQNWTKLVWVLVIPSAVEAYCWQRAKVYAECVCRSQRLSTTMLRTFVGRADAASWIVDASLLEFVTCDGSGTSVPVCMCGTWLHDIRSRTRHCLRHPTFSRFCTILTWQTDGWTHSDSIIIIIIIIITKMIFVVLLCKPLWEFTWPV